jgi:hypothetical protein
VHQFLAFVPDGYRSRDSHLSIPTYAFIQMCLSAAVAALVLVFHFADRVASSFVLDLSGFELDKWLPYIAAVVGAAFCLMLYRNRDRAYRQLRQP